MFPLPIIQVAWVWPLTTQRYAIATLAGCSWIAWPSWPYMVFFVLAPVTVALITSGYAKDEASPLLNGLGHISPLSTSCGHPCCSQHAEGISSSTL
ncbi:hypothetical protein LB505_000089 [Fusarium chuoi]|nr:hypothetical protein LB505_000089 [Fusarium chuoi]